MKRLFHEFELGARDPDTERDPLGAGTTLAASSDSEFTTACGPAGSSRPEGVPAQPAVPPQGPRASGERGGVTVETVATPRRWTPECRFIDDEDALRRQRRPERHGRERSRSVPMAAGIRYPGDGRLAVTSRELRDAYGAWIDEAADWVWFTTHTFVQDVFPDRAVSLFDRWSARLAEACRQKSGCSPELQSACAIEWTHAQRVHLHSVISARGLSGLRRLRWQHRWEELERCCGMARVLPATGRASAYLAKYCGKGGIVVVRGRFAGWSTSHNA